MFCLEPLRKQKKEEKGERKFSATDLGRSLQDGPNGDRPCQWSQSHSGAVTLLGELVGTHRSLAAFFWPLSSGGAE